MALADDLEKINALKKLSLEDLLNVQVETVTGASKFEQKISDAPADVTVLTADDIKLYGWRTLGDALRTVSGMVVTYDRGYAYLGVRGFNEPGDYSGRVLINVDGHRMNDAMFDTAAMDTDFPLDLDLIERIEVIRGPASSLYGNNAFFGVINIITRSAKQIDGTEIAGSYGTFDTFTGRATMGHQFTNGVNLVLSGSWYGSDGNPDLYYPQFSSVNQGHAHNMDDGWARRAFASISWHEITLEAGYSDRFKRVPTAPFSSSESEIVFNNPAFRMSDERAFGDLKYHHTFDNDWDVTARAYYDHYRYDGWYPYHYDPADPADPTTVNYDLDQSESVGGEIQASKELFEKHRIILGAESRYDYELHLLNKDLDPDVNYFDINRSGYFAGAYLDDEFRIRPNLILNAGARYDYFQTGGGAASPRAALIWHPWKPSTFKLLYGQAYRAANANENYYNWPHPTNTPTLDPETIRTYELHYEHQFNRVWEAKASMFYNELENTISGNGNAGFLNFESATTRGVETEVSAHWSNGFQGRASYTYSDARNDRSDDRLPNSPEHMFKANLAVPIWRQNVFASAELQFLSQRHTVSGGSVPGYWVVNAGIFSKELVHGLEISADVYNLFDQHYSDPASLDFVQPAIQQDGRTFRIKVVWRF